jgi:hypothetical protein
MTAATEQREGHGRGTRVALRSRRAVKHSNLETADYRPRARAGCCRLSNVALTCAFAENDLPTLITRTHWFSLKSMRKSMRARACGHAGMPRRDGCLLRPTTARFTTFGRTEHQRTFPLFGRLPAQGWPRPSTAVSAYGGESGAGLHDRGPISIPARGIIRHD